MTFLSETILREAWPQKGTRVGPEDHECIEFANWMKTEISNGRLRCVFMHVPNEGKRSYRQGSLQRAKGLISGTPDFLILYDTGCFCIEFKSKTGSQSKNQRDFEKWCKREGIPYKLVRSFEEAKEYLLDQPILWGRDD